MHKSTILYTTYIHKKHISIDLFSHLPLYLIEKSTTLQPITSIYILYAFKYSMELCIWQCKNSFIKEIKITIHSDYNITYYQAPSYIYLLNISINQRKRRNCIYFKIISNSAHQTNNQRKWSYNKVYCTQCNQ